MNICSIVEPNIQSLSAFFKYFLCPVQRNRQTLLDGSLLQFHNFQLPNDLTGIYVKKGIFGFELVLNPWLTNNNDVIGTFSIFEKSLDNVLSFCYFILKGERLQLGHDRLIQQDKKACKIEAR